MGRLAAPAADPVTGDTDFSRLNQSLYSTTWQQGPQCLADHTQEDCALNPSRAVPMVQVRERRSQEGGQPQQPNAEVPAMGRTMAGAQPIPTVTLCSKCGGGGHGHLIWHYQELNI